MSDISFGKPRMILTRGNWVKDRPTIDFDHKLILSDIMWEIQEFNDEEIWVQVPMSEYQKKQVPLDCLPGRSISRDTKDLKEL